MPAQPSNAAKPLILEAVMFSQVVSGQFPRKRIAATAVLDKTDYIIGIAVEHESGYHPSSARFKTHAEATAFADAVNEDLALSKEDAMRIVLRSMRPQMT